MKYQTRFAEISDEEKIYQLYKIVAENIGGIAREADEITPNYIANNLKNALATGISLVIDNPNSKDSIIAEIHCYKLTPRVFSHVLSELTIVVHPDFQGQGIGKILFTDLLQHIENTRPDILRVELIARESNVKAIEFYQKIGFKIEGRFEKRIDCKNGEFEADIPMAWFNKNFKK